MTAAAGAPVVVGLGMVAALGGDVRTNCAAARAGISRPSTLEHYRLRSAVDGEMEPVIGYQAALLTRGFEGDPRLVRLAHGALSDLIQESTAIKWSQWRHRFYLSLPDPLRTQSGAELIADDAAREALLAADAARRSEADLVSWNARRAATVLEMSAAAARWPGDATIAFASLDGHAGGLEALSVASRDVMSGDVEVAIVLGVDSLLDESTLEWLHSCDRLKCDAAPTGCQPGEAAVVMTIVSPELAAATGARALAAVNGVATAREPQAFLAAKSPAGAALADVIAQSLIPGGPNPPWVISDHNGEVYRATDWGHALVRLRAQFASFVDPILWYPAVSFGDTGAASALAAVCVVARAWSRNYAPASAVVVAAASDGEARAALTLTRATAHGHAVA